VILAVSQLHTILYIAVTVYLRNKQQTLLPAEVATTAAAILIPALGPETIKPVRNSNGLPRGLLNPFFHNSCLPQILAAITASKSSGTPNRNFPPHPDNLSEPVRAASGFSRDAELSRMRRGVSAPALAHDTFAVAAGHVLDIGDHGAVDASLPDARIERRGRGTSAT